MELNDFDKDGFYLADGDLERSYVLVRSTSGSVTFISRNYCAGRPDLSGSLCTTEIEHEQDIKPFPSKELKDVESVFIFWIPRRMQWVGFLFTITGDFVDEEEDYLEERPYYSQPYLAFTEDITPPTDEEVKLASRNGILVKRSWSYQEWLKLTNVNLAD